MPIYLMETKNGTRIVQAANQRSAINYVMRDEVKATPLSAVDLADAIREGDLEIEVVSARGEGTMTKAQGQPGTGNEPITEPEVTDELEDDDGF